VHRELGEHRIVETRQPRLIEQCGAGVKCRLRRARYLTTELFLHGQRGETRAAQGDQERALVVGVGARERLEVLIVHHDLDAVRAQLVPFAPNRDRQAREQTDDQNCQQKTAVEGRHRAASSPGSGRNRSVAAGPKKTTWPAVMRAMLPSRSRLPYYRVWATITTASHDASPHSPNDWR
jgi:hypothetical protein